MKQSTQVSKHQIKTTILKKQSNNTVVPVGQSLRLYASIVAQAGVSSYSPPIDNTNIQQGQQCQQLQQQQQQ